MGERQRIRTHIRRFDEDIQGGVPAGQVILVKGTPGTMKSSLVYSILHNNALDGTKCLYMTLEQSKANLLDQMDSLGLSYDDVADDMDIVDMSIVRKNLRQIESTATWLQMFKMYASSLQDNLGHRIMAVDSLDVLRIAGDMGSGREQMFHLFEWLRDLGVTTFIIAEANPDRRSDSTSDSAFLADTVISLEMQRVSDVDIQRRMRVVKMRSTDHRMGYYSLLFGEGAFTVAQAIQE